MRVLTFAAHQPYLFLFAGLDCDFDVIVNQSKSRFLQNWDPSVRPLPERFKLLEWEQAHQGLVSGAYDATMAHNLSDLADLAPFPVPLVFVVHNTLSGRLLEEKSSLSDAKVRHRVGQLLAACGGRVVCVSESKAQDWGLSGTVIHPGLDLDEFCDYCGEDAVLLRVANHLMERSCLLDYPSHQLLVSGFPLLLIGDNPNLPHAEKAESFEALKTRYRQCRAYVHTAVEGMEDGYNLAMLEAMATGMPVVGTAHASSPIVNGVNGFVSTDVLELRRGVRRLLNDVELARRMGAEARNSVRRNFSVQTFNGAWMSVFAERRSRRVQS